MQLAQSGCPESGPDSPAVHTCLRGARQLVLPDIGCQYQGLQDNAYPIITIIIFVVRLFWVGRGEVF